MQLNLKKQMTTIAAVLLTLTASGQTLATVYIWDGGAGSWADANWNGGNTAPAEDNAGHTLGYINDSFTINAGATIITPDRVVLAGGLLSATGSTLEFRPTTNSLSGLNLGHDSNGLPGGASTANFTDCTVVCQRADASGNGMRIDNNSTMTLNNTGLSIVPEQDASPVGADTIMLNIRGGGTVILQGGSTINVGYIDFDTEAGTVTLQSGSLTLTSSNPLRDVANFSGRIDFTGVAGNVSVINTNNTGSNTLAVRLAGGVFAIDGTVVTDQSTTINGRRFEMTTAGSSDTLSLVSNLGASDPVPADGATAVPVSQVLSWTGPGAITPLGYNVYLDTTDGTTLVRAFDDIDGDTTSYDPPGDLQHNTAYHWRVDTVQDNGSDPDIIHTGSDWSFTTPLPGIAVSESSGSTIVAEGGVGGNPAGDTLDVVLSAPPAAQVTITPGDPENPDQVTFSPTSLTFDSDDWSTSKTLTVTAVDDGTLESAVHSTSVAFAVASSDSGYNGVAVDEVPVAILENDCGAWGFFSEDRNQDCLVNILDLPLISSFFDFFPQWLNCSLPNNPVCQDARVQPNIIFVMADDFGFADTSNTLTTLGDPSDFYETPILERLSIEGMAFTNAYANQNCAPTRTAILSGAYAPRSTNNVYQVGSLNRGGSGTMLFGPQQGVGGNDDFLPTQTITHAETLQAAGYVTAYVGKFHVTPNSTQIVSDHGFDENFGGGTAGGPGAYHANGGVFGGSISPTLDPFAANYTQTYVDDNIKPYANGTSLTQIDNLVGTSKHVTDASADAAIDFMNNNNHLPFFIQFSTHAVHTPIDNAQARDDLLNKYQVKPDGVEDSNASFGALIEGMDQSVARLVDYLESTPDPRNPGSTLDQNTILVFYSDNGGKQSQSNNSVLKGQKGELDEGGIRVPLIFWSGNPSLVDGGTVNHTPVMPVDFYKTFAGFAGAELPLNQTLDGEDISGIVKDRTADLGRQSVFWHLPGYLNTSGRDQRPESVIRRGDWKLIHKYESAASEPFELYNLAADMDESSNVAGSEAARVLSMGTELMEWLEETQSPLATLRNGSLNITVDGWTYANGVITEYPSPGQTITINAGQEVPFVLQR